MHLLHTSSPIVLGKHGTLPPDDWLCHDINAAEMMVMAERGSTKTFSVGAQINGDVEDQSLLILRSGAIGDLLYLSPILRERKRLFPHLRLGLACFPKWHEVMCDSGAELLPYPLSMEDAKKWGIIASLEDTIELHHDRHATDALNDGLGILAVPLTDYTPAFTLNALEHAWAASEHPKAANRTRVGIQPRAGQPTRDYPPQLWMQVIERLIIKEGCEVFLFGVKGQIPPLKMAGLINLAERELTFRQSAAILATCDVFAGVDSCFMPLCHALDVPAIGLYAAFDWRMRTSKAPRTFALTGAGECAPCNWHRRVGMRGPMYFPPEQRCAKEGFCNVLASITPERIVAKLMSIERKAAA